MAFQTFDDEPNETAGAHTAPATQPAKKPNGAAANPVNPTEDFEFGDENYKSSSKLPRIKPEKGQVSRFFLVAGMKPKAKETHYIDGKGSFICLGEGCPACASGNQKRTRIVVLAVRYTNADPKTGKLGQNKPQYEVGWVLLSRANYSQMLDVLEEESTPYTVDWKLAHANRAFGYEFAVAARDAAYIKVGDQAVIAELVKEYADGEDLSKKLGKRSNAMELRTAMTNGGGLDESTLADLADLDN